MKSLSVYERSVYRKLAKEYPNQVIAPGKLRLESTITNSQNIIPFNVLEDTTVPTRTEKRLNKNDMFFMVSLGLFLAKLETGKEGRTKLLTYVNLTEFVAAAGFTPTDLEVVYNGNVSLKISTREYISILDTNRFRYVPQTQQTAATNYDQYNEDENFVDLPTHYKLRGTDQIELSVNLPYFNGIQVESVAAGFTNNLVLVPKGFIIKGGANLEAKQGSVHHRARA